MVEVAPAVFGLKEAAAYLGTGIVSLRRLCQTGELESWTTDGGRWRISRLACDRYIEKMERKRASH